MIYTIRKYLSIRFTLPSSVDGGHDSEQLSNHLRLYDKRKKLMELNWKTVFAQNSLICLYPRVEPDRVINTYLIHSLFFCGQHITATKL
jgi:hypothetical protein